MKSKKFKIKEWLKSELVEAIRENRKHQFRQGRPFYYNIEVLSARKTMKEPTYVSKVTNKARKGIRLRCGDITFSLVIPESTDQLVVDYVPSKGIYLQLYDVENKESGGTLFTNDNNIIKFVKEQYEWAHEYINILRLAYLFYNPAVREKKLKRRAYPHREYSLGKELRVRILFQRPLEHLRSNLLIYPTGEVYEDVSVIRRVTTVVPIFLIRSETDPKGAYRRPRGKYAFKLYLKTRASLFYIAELHNEFYKFFIRYVSYKLKQKRYIFKKAREFYNRMLKYYREKYYDEHGHYPF